MYIFSFISYFRSWVIVEWSVLNEKFSVSHWLPTWLLTCYNHFHMFFSPMKPIINLYYGFGYVSVRPSKFKVFWNQYFTQKITFHLIGNFYDLKGHHLLTEKKNWFSKSRILANVKLTFWYIRKKVTY